MGCVCTKGSVNNQTIVFLPTRLSIRILDSSLQHRTNRVISSLAAGSLSLDSLREVTRGLLENNQEAVNILIESEQDIWKNDGLFRLVKDFFNLSLLTLDFCNSLQNCLKTARHRYRLSFIRIAISQFDGDNDYLKTLEQFRKFETLDDPFSEEFFELFQLVYKQQLLMLKKLQIQKGKVDKKLKSTKVWKRLTNVIFVVTFSTVLICSVVAALAASAAVAMGPMGKWVNSLWKKYERELKGQRGVIGSMRVGSYVVIRDLDNIKVLVDKVRIEMECLVQNAEFVRKEEKEEAVAMVVDEMRKTVNDFGKTIDELSNDFGKTIDELSDHSDKCCRDIMRARMVIVQKMTKQPSNPV